MAAVARVAAAAVNPAVRCGSAALIGLLASDNTTVREWAAMALANLGIDGAIERLRRANRARINEPRRVPAPQATTRA